MINIIYNDYYMILAMDKEQWKELWIYFDVIYYYYYDIIIYQGRMSDRYEQAMDQWAMDRYEQQEQVRQDEGINLILIYIIQIIW